MPDFIEFYVENTGFRGRDPVRSKIVVTCNTIQFINTCSYLDCSVSYQNEKYIAVKISTFLQKTGNINTTLKPSQVQNHTRLEIYNISALHNLLYG